MPIYVNSTSPWTSHTIRDSDHGHITLDTPKRETIIIGPLTKHHQVSNDSSGGNAGDGVVSDFPDYRYTTGGQRVFGSNFFLSAEKYLAIPLEGVQAEPLPATEVWER
jgi:hypothetical protein